MACDYNIEEFLQELKAIELIYEKSVFPELAYIFKHALTHEVAYNSLLVQRPKELHRLIALAIEELYADRLAEQYKAGLVLSEKVGTEIRCLRFLNSIGWLYSELGDLNRAIDLNRRGAEESRKRGDPETIANAEINLADIFLVQGDLALAQEFLDGVYQLAHDPTTSEWMKWRYSTHLFASLGELWLGRGDPAKARESTDQCLELATRTNSRKYLVKGYRLMGEIAPPAASGTRRRGCSSRP